MKTILVVCTGNICRSPMAAALLRHKLAQLGLAADVEVISAGIWAEAGSQASRHAAGVLGTRGVDLGDHRSQPLTPALVKRADIILVMEEAHRRSIFHLAPQHLAKVFLLSEMAGRHHDIEDPYGGEYEDYVQTANELDALIDKGLPGILKRIGLAPSASSAH